MAREQGMIEPFADGQTKKLENGLGALATGFPAMDTTCESRANSRSSPTFSTRLSIRKTLIRIADRYSHRCLYHTSEFLRSWHEVWSTFRIPRDVLTVCLGKSTYARCGIIVNVTPFEPEWEGHVTLEISNTTPLPAKIYANEGLAQVVFFLANEVCETSYADRGGKYMRQTGITIPKM